MGISSIYIMDQKGRVLITRAYRADVPYSANEIFQDKLLALDEMNLKPVIVDKENQLIFLHTRYQNLIFLLTATKDINTVMAFDFLYKFIDVLKEYFGEVEEESVRDNFVIIYELLDEMMDNGYPQHTEVNLNFILSSKFIG